MSKRKKKRKNKFDYPNGGDGMFFYHKLTNHPAKQISHTEKTWTNKRYTHSPNNLGNYLKDEELSTEGKPVYYHKSVFVDRLFTRGNPYKMQKEKASNNASAGREHSSWSQRDAETSSSENIKSKKHK